MWMVLSLVMSYLPYAKVVALLSQPCRRFCAAANGEIARRVVRVGRQPRRGGPTRYLPQSRVWRLSQEDGP